MESILSTILHIAGTSVGAGLICQEYKLYNSYYILQWTLVVEVHVTSALCKESIVLARLKRERDTECEDCLARRRSLSLHPVSW